MILFTVVFCDVSPNDLRSCPVSYFVISAEWTCPVPRFVTSSGMVLSTVMFCHVSRTYPVRCHVSSCQPEWTCPVSCFVTMRPRTSRTATNALNQYSSVLIALCGWNGARARSAGQSTKNRVTMSLFILLQMVRLMVWVSFSEADSNTRDDHGHALVTLGAQRGSFSVYCFRCLNRITCSLHLQGANSSQTAQ